MRGFARKMPHGGGLWRAMNIPAVFPAMLRLAVLLPLLLALVLPAAAQEAKDKLKFHPKEVVKLKLLPGRPAQGIWEFGNGQYLVTQDADGRNGHEWVRFTLFDQDGDVIKKWELNYGTHGQSLFLKRREEGFIIYTESRNRKGMALFEMSADRTEIKFLNRVIPKTKDGKTVEFDAFGVDGDSDTIIVADGGTRKSVRYFKFSDFTAGLLTPLSKPIVIQRTNRGKQLGSLQGVGTDNGIGYVLTGDAELDTKKYISRLDDEGNLVPVEINPDRDKATFYYEPEGLYVRKGRILFTMYDHFWTRVYEVKAK
jgi:hypothetical protein